MRFQLPRALRRVEQDVDDELAFHLEQRAAELIRAGLLPEEARREAERRFGGLDAARGELAGIDRRRRRAERRAAWWAGLRHDARYAARGLARSPGLTLAVVLTIGVGIGATATMFGIIDRLLLRPPAHVAAPGAVGRLYFTQYFSWLGMATQESSSYPDFALLRDGVPSLGLVTAYFQRSASLGRGAEAEPVATVAASGEYFRLLQVQPQLGRFFDASDDAPPDGTPVAVLSDGFWRRRFGGDRSVLGATLEVDRKRYTVVGVAPRDFTGVSLEPVDLWIPLATQGTAVIGAQWDRNDGWRWIRLLGRLAPGATRASVNAEATTVYRAALADRGRPDSTARVTLGSIFAARAPDTGRRGLSDARIAVWLGGVSLLVLLIACANVANLLLARAAGRRREIGVRLALGVTRARLVGQLLTESLLLAMSGGVVGVLLAHWGGAAARGLLLGDLRWRDRLFDPRVLGVAGLLVLVVAVLAGLAPAVHALGQRVVDAVKAGGRTGGAVRARTRRALVLAQATLSVILLAGAGLFVRSLTNVRGIPLGFDADRVLVVGLNATDPAAGAPDALYREARDRLNALPVVERASVALTAPFWSALSTELHVPGLDSLPATSDGGPYVNAVTPEFFRTMGTALLRGRDFTDADAATAPRVAVVSETFARRVWPGQDPLGRCLFVGGDTVPCSTVVGVVADAKRESLIGEAPVMQYYVPLAQRQVTAEMRVLFVRTAGDGRAALDMIRRAVQGVSPDLPYPTIRSLEELIAPEVRPWKLGATLFGVFGLIAIALAALGLYSVVAYSVAQREHELGVRTALGARGRDLARMVLGESFRVVGVGLAVGVLLVLAVGRWTAPLLYEVSPRDPLVLGGVMAVLALMGAVAGLAPARRAARVSPAEVLRADG